MIINFYQVLSSEESNATRPWCPVKRISTRRSSKLEGRPSQHRHIQAAKENNAREIKTRIHLRAKRFENPKKSDHLFLDAYSHLYKRVCPFVGPSVRHTRVEFLRNGPKLNKIASGIR